VPQRRAELLGPGRGGQVGAEVEARAELRTPARGADAGEGNPERQVAGGGDEGRGAGGCEREQSQSGSWKCAAAAAPSLGHSLLFFLP